MLFDRFAISAQFGPNKRRENCKLICAGFLSKFIRTRRPKVHRSRFRPRSGHKFAKWYEQIVRYIRKAFVRNPASLSGYVGSEAHKWFLKGGLLLPTFIPPVTDAWRRFFDEEDSIRKRLNEVGLGGRLSG